MVKDQKLDYSVLGDPTNAQMCVVFIHGWSGNKDSFRRVAKSFSIRNCVWYLPQAPYLLEKEGGYSWTYEISPGKFEREQPVRMLLDFFDNQIFSKFDSRDVYLFGFSQGGLVCYEMIRVLDKRLGGVFPIGGFMAGTKKQMQRINPQQKDTPIIIGHGDQDEVISADESRLAHRLLSQESSEVTIDIYRGGHKIGLDYLRKAKEFIEKEYE